MTGFSRPSSSLAATLSVAACFLAVGCKSSSSKPETVTAPSAEKAPAPAPGRVTGLVYMTAGGGIPKGAELTVKLVDATVSGQYKTLTQVGREVETWPPYAFSLAPKAGTIDPGHTYHVEAELRYKDQRWSNMRFSPVLTGNAPSYVEVEVTPSALPTK